MYDLLIIGSGPAGVSAALSAKARNLDFLWFGSRSLSGKIEKAERIMNYPGLPAVSGGEMRDAFLRQIDGLGIAVLEERVNSIYDMGGYYAALVNEKMYEGRAVILATGVSGSREIPGESRLLGRGVSYCATCDGAFYRKSTVAVVGGGDVAVEDAVFLAGICEKVYLIHRRNQLRAAESLQRKLLSLENVEIIWDSEVEEILGSEMVEGIKIYNKKNSGKDTLDVEGVFIAVGIVPDTSLLNDLVEMDEKGYIIADETCATSRKGIFAAGDIRKKPMRQIITAVADGANAVHSVQEFLYH